MRSVLRGLLLLVAAVCADGCESCREQAPTYALSDAQLARVTEGTGSPTMHGCNVVCWEEYWHDDAGLRDGGLPPSSPYGGPVTCTLNGHALICDFGQQCAV